jgi:hypothetical protein
VHDCGLISFDAADRVGGAMVCNRWSCMPATCTPHGATARMGENAQANDDGTKTRKRSVLHKHEYQADGQRRVHAS